MGRGDLKQEHSHLSPTAEERRMVHQTDSDQTTDKLTPRMTTTAATIVEGMTMIETTRTPPEVDHDTAITVPHQDTLQTRRKAHTDHNQRGEEEESQQAQKLLNQKTIRNAKRQTHSHSRIKYLM